LDWRHFRPHFSETIPQVNNFTIFVPVPNLGAAKSKQLLVLQQPTKPPRKQGLLSLMACAYRCVYDTYYSNLICLQKQKAKKHKRSLPCFFALIW
jgi:hypothetical protein